MKAELNKQYLEQLRAERGISFKELARLMGQYEGHYRKALSGSLKLRAEDIVKLINIYSLTDEQILMIFSRGGKNEQSNR